MVIRAEKTIHTAEAAEGAEGANPQTSKQKGPRCPGEKQRGKHKAHEPPHPAVAVWGAVGSLSNTCKYMYGLCHCENISAYLCALCALCALCG